jgi:hypothetical protein
MVPLLVPLLVLAVPVLGSAPGHRKQLYRRERGISQAGPLATGRVLH